MTGFERAKVLLHTQANLTLDNMQRISGVLKKRETSIVVVLMLVSFLFAYISYHIAYWNLTGPAAARTAMLIIGKFANNIPMICITVLGMKVERNLYSVKLIFILIYYMLGDVIATFSVGASVIPYTIGHVLFLQLIYQESYVNRWQYFCVIPLFIAALIVLFSSGLGVLFILGGIPYALLICTLTAASLNNPFYVLGGIVFMLSDLFGLLSLPLTKTWQIYCITNFSYYLAIILIAMSVFVNREKSIVTGGELRKIVDTLQRYGVRFWLAGGWSASVVIGFNTYQFKDVDIICAEESKEAFQKALVEMKYLKPYDPLNIAGMLYSVKFGILCYRFLEQTENGPAIWSDEGIRIPVDNEMFGERTIGKYTVPCLTIGIDKAEKEKKK